MIILNIYVKMKLLCDIIKAYSIKNKTICKTYQINIKAIY